MASKRAGVRRPRIGNRSRPVRCNDVDIELDESFLRKAAVRRADTVPSVAGGTGKAVVAGIRKY